MIRKTLEALIAEERSKQHHILADKLEDMIRNYSATMFTNVNNTTSHIDDKIHSLCYEVAPQRQIDDLILPQNVYKACKEIVEEHHRSDLLRSYNLEPRSRILLCGPPGNGKTSLAEAIAGELYIPLVVVRYDGVIASYLGETAQRLKKLFDYVRTRRCVLFFDEFDSIGKERGDTHETGEIKRVVSSLLLQIDDLPSHVVVITATNHPELLDRAVWRRFQARLMLPAPDKKQVKEWFEKFAVSFQEPLGCQPAEFAECLQGLSFAELKEFCADIQRRYVLSIPSGNVANIVKERLEQWKHRYSIPARRRDD